MGSFTRGELDEMQAGVKPSGAMKSMTFSNVAGSGALNDTIKLFAVTGTVICSLRGYVETTLAGATATLVHGVAGTTNMLIPILTCTNMVANAGIDSTAAVVARGTALTKVPLWSVTNTDIIATDATAAITAGKINYILDYIAITPNAAVTAY
jgi:hypothetical protein